MVDHDTNSPSPPQDQNNYTTVTRPHVGGAGGYCGGSGDHDGGCAAHGACGAVVVLAVVMAMMVFSFYDACPTALAALISPDPDRPDSHDLTRTHKRTVPHFFTRDFRSHMIASCVSMPHRKFVFASLVPLCV